MADRLLLVIGSQCKKLNKLSFLPEVATRLHELLSQPGPGGCTEVTLDGHLAGLLLDPTVDQAKEAIEAAIDQAAKSRATLILADIGHGEFPDEMSGDFYLMPTDADKLTDRGAIHFANFLNDCLKPPQDRVDLVVLIDTCHAGVAAWKSMERWTTSRRGDLGFELLTATDDRATANAPLARQLIELLERGDPEFTERIHGRDVHARLKKLSENWCNAHVVFWVASHRPSRWSRRYQSSPHAIWISPRSLPSFFSYRTSSPRHFDNQANVRSMV